MWTHVLYYVSFQKSLIILLDFTVLQIQCSKAATKHNRASSVFHSGCSFLLELIFTINIGLMCLPKVPVLSHQSKGHSPTSFVAYLIRFFSVNTNSFLHLKLWPFYISYVIMGCFIQQHSHNCWLNDTKNDYCYYFYFTFDYLLCFWIYSNLPTGWRVIACRF